MTLTVSLCAAPWWALASNPDSSGAIREVASLAAGADVVLAELDLAFANRRSIDEQIAGAMGVTEKNFTKCA